MDRERREPDSIRRKKKRRLSEEEIRRRRKIRAKREAERRELERLDAEHRRRRKPIEKEENNNEVSFLTKLKNKSLIKKVLLAVAVIMTLLIISGIISIIGFFMKIDNDNIISASSPSKNSPVNILVLGMDIGDPNQAENESIKRTDTMMLVNYNPNSKTTKIVSIPRDILVANDGSNYKINAAYQKGGEGKVKQVIDDMLGIKINYVVKIDYAAFRDFIDSIGGIEMEIERDMIYDDDGQNLHINFKKGTTVHLDGQKAEEFFRWRKNNDGSGLANGDLDRIENQHKFIEKVSEKCSGIGFVFKIPKILNSVAENMETNMSAFNIINYGLKVLNSRSNTIEMVTLVGTPKTIGGQDYLIFDKNSNKEIIEALKSTSSVGLNKEDANVIILNGTNINGLAAQVKTDLNAAGYKKVDTGNGNKIEKSVVMTDNKDLKENIMEILPRISKSESKSKDSKYSEYDVVIMLGEDYKK